MFGTRIQLAFYHSNAASSRYTFCILSLSKKKKKKSKEMEHMEHGTSNLKNAIVLLHIREAYIIAIDVAK